MHNRSSSYLRYVLVVVALILLPVLSASAALTPEEQQLLRNLDTTRMMHTIERLCCDSFAGRKAGGPENKIIADYLESQFQANGLLATQDRGAEGYRQPLTMRYSLIKCKDDIKATLTYNAAAGKSLIPRTKTLDYTRYNGNGGLDISSDVVFVGYGVCDPDAGYDDYQGVDVTGKIVLWLAGEPKVKLTKTHTGDRKVFNAYQRGAAACLVCKPVELKDEVGTDIGLAGAIADFPYIAVDSRIAHELFPQVAADSFIGLIPGHTGVKVRLRITPVCDPERKTWNIIGEIPGADPEVANEVVLIGAHYDHLGKSESGIFRGADDNASGSSVVLEAARAICVSGLKPRRTIVFALWAGEEAGLVGSNYFASHPLYDLKRIVSSIQLDMVGRGHPNSFMTTGARAHPSHYAHLSSSAEDLGISLIPDAITGASDHLAFVRKRVPTSLLYSSGEHTGYHTVKDVPDTIDLKVVGSASRLATLAVWRAAN